MKWFIALCLTLVSFSANARWKPEYAKVDPAITAWYEKQAPTPETLKAYDIQWVSCCVHADVCQGCVVHHVSDRPPWRDGWYYEKDGKTYPIPPHTVHYVPWTPTGKPVLFRAPFAAGKVLKDDVVCLKVPGGAT